MSTTTTINVSQIPVLVSVEESTSLVKVSQTPTQVSVEPETNQIEVLHLAVLEIQIGAIGIQGVKGDSGENSLTDFKLRALQGFPNPHKELTYLNGDLSEIKTWDSSAKTILLLTTAFTYAGQDLSQLRFTNDRSAEVLVVSFTYDGDGNLMAIGG